MDNIKYPTVTLTRQVKDLCNKNFKSVKKKIKEDGKVEISPMLTVEWD